MAYFKPLRRKMGIFTLVVACILMAMWIESLRVEHLIACNQNYFISIDGGLIWDAPVQQPSRQSRDFQFRSSDLKTYPWLATQYIHPMAWSRSSLDRAGFVVAEHHFHILTEEMQDVWELNRFCRVPYWAVVIPLTTISVWLLLGKPKLEKTTIEPQANA